MYEVLRQVKQIFDPENVLNPGKIISDDPDLMTRNLRPPLRPPQREGDLPADDPKSPALRDLVELQVNWDPQRVADATAACNRCGECRSQSPLVRMCPIFRYLPTEEASPRAKAEFDPRYSQSATSICRSGDRLFPAK